MAQCFVLGRLVAETWYQKIVVMKNVVQIQQENRVLGSSDTQPCVDRLTRSMYRFLLVKVLSGATCCFFGYDAVGVTVCFLS